MSFSYAQAAQGRSAAKLSGTEVQSSNPAAEDVQGLTVDSKAEAHAGDTSSVTSANNNDDGSPTATRASSESTWDTKSQNSNSDRPARADASDSKTDAAGAKGETPKQQKPKYRDAVPPPVNPWEKRASTMTQKPTPSAHTTTNGKQERKSEKAKNADTKKSVAGSTRNREQRQTAEVPKARINGSAPPPTSDVAWPTMETAREEERKKNQVQEEKASKETSTAPAAKKTEWVNLPYVPTAVFETTLPARGAPRAATRGGSRGGSNMTGRTTYQNGQNGDKSASKPVDATQEQIAAANAEADRESMPPPPKPVKVDESKDAASTNGVSHETPVTNGAPKGNPSARRPRSPRKFEPSARRQSAASATADALNGAHPEAAKTANKERTSDNPQSFREPKTSKRGRGGHRGGLTNGHFPSQNFANGFPGDFTPAAPSFPPRGGHFPQQNRGGFRGGMRSQSIPFDYSRGQYPGYPMMAPQGYGPEFYGGYMPPVPAYQPGAEQMYLVPAISQQIEYYFSLDNLVKDTFFRKHMDSQGFVFLTFVADFNRLKSLTADYELLKYVCLNSPNIELRTGQDGKDRLRKAGDWEMWVLPMTERDPSAQNDGPVSFERPPVPHIGMAAPFYPGGMEQFAENAGFEEFRGRQAKSPHRENGMSPIGSYFIPAEDMGGEPDNFPNAQIDVLTVVVRKHEETPRRAPYHTAASRTFSDGSIDSKNIYEEVQKTKAPEKKPETNETEQQVATNGDGAAVDGPAVTLFWVKDQNSPVDTLPEDTTHEMYSHLRGKALSQREVAATGTCPYDMDVLYQFWSHFLIRNFNSSMYAEFRHLAFVDAAQRHNSTGIENLIKYYSEALASQIPIREQVGRHFAELLQSEKAGGERVAFNQLRESWRSSSFNIGNRKKFGEMIDADLKTELEA